MTSSTVAFRDDETREDHPMLRPDVHRDDDTDDGTSDYGQAGRLEKESGLSRPRPRRTVAWPVSLFLLVCLSFFALSGILLSHFFDELPPPATPNVPEPTASAAPVETTPGDEGIGNPGTYPAQAELDLKTGFVVSAVPTTREYVFNVTWGLAAPDGFKRSMILVNGQSPGPLIEANTGDVIRVTVNNLMPRDGTSIHWHGIDQRNSNWMDGVHGVTQCAIPPGQSFGYEFNVTGQRGTFWYHGHVSVQLANGLYGPLIIHDPDEKVPPVDDDKIVMFGDLFHHEAEKLASQYLSTSPPWGHGAGLEPPLDNIIMNGRHVSNCSFSKTPSPRHDDIVAGSTLHCASGSIHTTRVRSGDQVRFRLISHSTNTPFHFTIDNHTLHIVEIDGTEIEPITTTRVFMNPGQRYSVIVAANNTPGHYRMRAAAATSCFHLAKGDSTLASVNFEAVGSLLYDDVDAKAEAIGSRWNLDSAVNSAAGREPWTPCRDLPFDLPKPVRKAKAYEAGERNHHYFSFDRQNVNGTVRSFINQTNYATPKNDAAIWKALEQDMTPQNLGATAPKWDFGLNQPILVSRDADKGAQIVVNAQAMMLHPFHLHGQSFQVVGWGPQTYGVGNTTWNLENPMRRDTITIPGFSHLVIRIRADNPGIWAFHCHILWHAEEGMFVLIAQQLGELAGLLGSLDESNSGQAFGRRFCSPT